MSINMHKAFCDIEADVKRFYDEGPRVDAQLTALKVAGRALSIAESLVEPADQPRVLLAKSAVFDLIQERQLELDRASRE